MPVHARPADLGAARGRMLVSRLCRELDETRSDRGLSYAAMGRAVGLTGQQIGRICRGGSARVTVLRIAQLYALVGLDLTAKGYPAGQPLRDSGHLDLLERLRRRLAPSLRWRTEVPVVATRSEAAFDRRAWDATVGGSGWTFGIEAETHVRDVQALERRLALKERDGDVSGVILLLNDSGHHREVVRAASASLRPMFPASARSALASLRRGECPIGSAIVLA